MIILKKNDKQQLYTDDYFEKGHWLRKIFQTLIALIGWFCVIIPIVITVTAFWANFNPKIPHLWSYAEGILEIRFIGVILFFAFVMSGIFAISMTIIQNRKRDRLVEQWPTFNPINQRRREDTLAKFIDHRFGDQEFRENVRTLDIQPEQNLDTDTIQKLYEKNNLNDLD